MKNYRFESEDFPQTTIFIQASDKVKAGFFLAHVVAHPEIWDATEVT